MVDLHRHDEYSTFDGFGKATELAELAKELGHTSLSTSNHGNTNGLVKHYKACKKYDIRCIMGVEAYFQPKRYSDEEKVGKDRYHLCLFAKNLKGYKNMNTLMYEGEKNKYYKPIITFDMLEEYNEGLICTSACVSGFISKAIGKDRIDVADKAIKKFKNIFGEDFYIEIQPYEIPQKGLQEKVNVELMKLAYKNDVKMILTSDSHYGKREEFDTYKKMHAIKAHAAKKEFDEDNIEKVYGERYMPTKKEICNRTLKMHKKDFEKLGKNPKEEILKMIKNLEEIEEKVEQDILDKLEQKLPKLAQGHDSYDVLLKKVKEGLKNRFKEYPEKRKKKDEYIDRCKQELEVIKAHDISDYFLIVQDYVLYSKSNGIPIGPGRGSVCNSQVAWALSITDVDSLKFGLDFRRFLRMDKKKLPDVDLDFATNRRQEVIDYLVHKYKGHAAQICSYGLYKVDNLVNDLAGVCGLDTTGDIDKEEKNMKRAEIANIKSFINSCIGEDENFYYDKVKQDSECKMYDKKYDNIIKHFSKLYKKMRFIGTHAAGVAITSENLLEYTSLRIVKDKETGIEKIYTSYDLADLDDVHVVKFDMLGLKTMESIGELRELTGNGPLNEKYLEDENVLTDFREGNCDGVFQFEKATARKILSNINADCFEDIVAASSMNRPGPLSLKMPDTYAHNKQNIEEAKASPFYKYTASTYGTIVYQEQLQIMCVEIGKLTWQEADRVMKLMKNAIASMGELEKINKDKHDLTEKFVKGAVENGYDEKLARHTFENMLVYTFNKGHGVGYGMISMEEGFYKHYYPLEYWYTKLKHCNDEANMAKFKEKAVASGALVFLPHVNYSADFSLRKIDGDKVIQEGIRVLKGVGPKAADFIEAERKANGIFRSYDDFYDRCKSRTVTSKVINILIEAGALEFNKKTYIERVKKYNSSLYMRGMKCAN